MKQTRKYKEYIIKQHKNQNIKHRAEILFERAKVEFNAETKRVFLFQLNKVDSQIADNKSIELIPCFNPFGQNK